MFQYLMTDREYRQRRMAEIVNPGIFDEPVEPPDTVLLTVPQAAELLSISEKTLFTLAKEGRIRQVKIGTAVRYRKYDLNVFMEEQARISKAGE